MKTSPRVVFFGNERLVSGLKHTDAPILTGLIERGYQVVAVVAHHSTSSSRSSRPLEVAEIAKAHGIPLFVPNKPIEILDELVAAQADCAILSAYGRIIPQRVIDVFSPVGIINIHPSLLPRHRGSTPIETTILAGDTNAGVSIMQLTAGMDEGPIFGQQTVENITAYDKFELYQALADAGTELLFNLLPAIISGELKPTQQQTSNVTYTSLISKSDSIINPTTDTAIQISRQIKAHLVFPKSRLTYADKDVIITSSKVVSGPIKNAFVIPCKNDSYLLVESLIAPNGKKMSGEAFLRGLR